METICWIQELMKAVTYFVVQDGLPMYTVGKPGVCQMIQSFDPRYHLGRKTLILVLSTQFALTLEVFPGDMT